MRVPFDLRRCVVFLGYASADKFDSRGTGFLHHHKGFIYLVTAAHVAEGLGENPFWIRMNKIGGGAEALYHDPIQTAEPRVRWFLHEDQNVDLAVLPFHLDFEKFDGDGVMLQTSGMVETKNPMEDGGCGDFCYVIGLFSKLQGKSQNLPVVHTGHIALLPNRNELIETKDPNTGKVRNVEGYLVEITNLSGLSGAPVFVRGGFEIEYPAKDGKTLIGILADPMLKLLGVWQGSWEGYSVDSQARVPVGMGIVTPSWKLAGLLDSEPVEKNRRQWRDDNFLAKTD